MVKNRKNRKDIVTVAEPIMAPVTTITVPIIAELTMAAEQLDAQLVIPAVAPMPKRSRKAAPKVEETRELTLTELWECFYPAGQPIQPVMTGTSIEAAVKLLSRQLPISSLPEGSYINLDGRFGMFVEMSGPDAKVDIDGRHEFWSGMSEVHWSPVRPATTKLSQVTVKATSGKPKAIEANGTASPVPASKPVTAKPPKPEGPNNKEITYQAWLANPAVTAEELHELVNGQLAMGTIRGRLKAWPKGQKLPACAKQNNQS